MAMPGALRYKKAWTLNPAFERGGQWGFRLFATIGVGTMFASRELFYTYSSEDTAMPFVRKIQVVPYGVLGTQLTYKTGESPPIQIIQRESLPHGLDRHRSILLVFITSRTSTVDQREGQEGLQARSISGLESTKRLPFLTLSETL